MSRTIVIGDIHGCVREFRELLSDMVELRPNDKVVLLGDLIDRGPDPAGVVESAYALRVQCVMGNHEEKALRWRRHERRRKEDLSSYKNPMREIDRARLEQWAKIPDHHWDWIATWPTFVHINEKWTGVHAGCLPDVEIEQQVPNELMRMRYVKCTPTPHGYMKYKMASLKATGEPPDAEDGESVVHWTELWSGPRNIVYGHYVWDEVHITSHRETGVRTIGIDTGCVHGGELTALVFHPNNPDPVRVTATKAYKTYAERKLWTDE